MNELSPYVIKSSIPRQLEYPEAAPGESPIDLKQGPNLRDYWLVIRKHIAIVATCFFSALIVAVVVIFTTTPVYTARTTLLIERKEPQVVDVKNVLSESADSNDLDYYKTQYELLKSRSLAAQIIRSEGLEKNVIFSGDRDRGGFVSVLRQLPVKAFTWVTALIVEPATVKRADPIGVKSEVVDAYLGMLEIEPIQRTRLAKIAFNTPDPELSAQLANAHAEAYIQQGLKLRTRANQEAESFLEEKLGQLKQRVEEAETALNLYRREKGIISLDEKENIVVDRLTDLNKRLTEAEAERIGLEAHLRLIQKRDYDSLPAVIGNSLVSSLKTQLTQLQGEYANLSAQFKSGYPRVVQIKASMEETQLRLQQEIKKIVGGIESAYLAASGKEQDLRAKMEQQKTATLQLKDASIGYAVLAREADANRVLYNSVLERMKEVGVAAALRASNVSVIDKSEPPGNPSKPKKKLILSFAALLGLMGGLGLALLFEHLDDTIKTQEDAERYLCLPSLGLVPNFPGSDRSLIERASIVARGAAQQHANGASASSVTFYPSEPEKIEELGSLLDARFRRTEYGLSFDSLGVVNEAYRTLRTGILLSQTKQPPKTVLFTSAVHGEGKTATVVNSAVSFARMGARVLLIDADLRRPACHQILGMRRGLGVAELLGGHIKVSWAIQPTHVENLFFVSSGSSRVDPTEFIGSAKMGEILSLVRQPYDYVLIDSPPVMAVSDALLLSTMVDGVVVVIGARGTPRDTVRHACSRLRQAQANILGTMINRVNMNDNHYSDGYYGSFAHAEGELTG